MAAEPDIRSVGDALEGLVHQFADPWAFLRELIQNAIDAGSGEIEVRIDHDPDKQTMTIEVVDSGEGMTREIIDTRLTRLFSSAKEGDYTKIGRFGIGFVSVFALDPEIVCVDTGRAGEYWRVLFRRDRTFERIRLSAPVEGTTIRLFKKASEAEADEARVRAAETLGYWCKHVRVEVRLDGVPVSGPLDLEGLCKVTHEEEGTALVMALVPERAGLRGYYHGGLTLHEELDESLPHVAFKVDSRFLEHSLTRDNVIRDEHYAKAMAIVERVARTRLVSALFARLAEVAAGDDTDAASREVMVRCAAAMCEAGEPDPRWLAMPVVAMIDGPPRSLADLRERRRARQLYRASEMSPVCARLLADGHLIVRCTADDGVPALIRAVCGETPIPVASLCTALAVSDAEAKGWARLASALSELLKAGKWKVPAVLLGRLDYPESPVVGRVAISQAQFGELTRVAEIGELSSGWLANGRVLVLAVDNPALGHLRVVAEQEPELAAYLALKLFFLSPRPSGPERHGELTPERDAELATLAAEARWRRI